jgi:hypothetical protein
MSKPTISEPFGRRAARLSSPHGLLALELEEGKGNLFDQIDGLNAFVSCRALRGEAEVIVERSSEGDHLSIKDLNPIQTQILENIYAVQHQHSRGTWFLPEKATLKAGLVNLPSIFRKYPRFGHHIVADGTARVVFAESPAAVFIWAVLEPLFYNLFLPLEMRANWSGLKSREEHLSAWAEVDRLVAALGLKLDSELAAMRYGAGWGRLSSKAQTQAKQNLISSIADQTTEALARRFRAFCCLDLVMHYYSRAQDGRATRKRALNRVTDKKCLVAFFHGDWLRFLQYLGETPHPDEQVALAIPRARFFVGGAKSPKSPAAIAEEKGVSLDEVQRVLATYWDAPDGRAKPLASPVEERVGVLRDFWSAFDTLHSRQTSGMSSLWGLLEESRSIRIGWQGPDWYSPRLYQELIPEKLTASIEELWGAIMLPQRPDRIASEIAPHALMAETFGSALSFWHGCGLAAWFLCEGPYSRTDIQGMPSYYGRQLYALEQLGAPIPPSLFTELGKAEARLGPVVPLERSASSTTLGSGASIEMRVAMGSRRDGFQILRDIISRYRREWAKQYLTTYLRARWKGDLGEPARLYAQTIADKGRPPGPKQLARMAAVATNRWFGGDISSFCAAIGEKSAFHPTRSPLMPADRLGFAKKVLAALQAAAPVDDARAEAAGQRSSDLERLAEESLRFVQLRECLGRSPTAKEFGRFDYLSATLGDTVDRAWKKYSQIILRELDEFPKTSSPEQGPSPLRRRGQLLGVRRACRWFVAISTAGREGRHTPNPLPALPDLTHCSSVTKTIQRSSGLRLEGHCSFGGVTTWSRFFGEPERRI